MAKTKRRKLNPQEAERICEYYFYRLDKDKPEYPICIYRDNEGFYWWYYEKEGCGSILTTTNLINHLVWFYCAYAERGDMRSSNDIVKWVSEKWDINRVISEACAPENVARYDEEAWGNYR